MKTEQEILNATRNGTWTTLEVTASAPAGTAELEGLLKYLNARHGYVPNKYEDTSEWDLNVTTSPAVVFSVEGYEAGTTLNAAEDLDSFIEAAEKARERGLVEELYSMRDAFPLRATQLHIKKYNH